MKVSARTKLERGNSDSPKLVPGGICVRGHLLTSELIYTNPNYKFNQSCRICKRMKDMSYQSKPEVIEKKRDYHRYRRSIGLGRESNRISSRKTRLRFSEERFKARRVVRSAIESGKIIKPKKCSSCGENEKFGNSNRSLLHAHHNKGYDKPLAIIWLCTICHSLEHRRNRMKENP